MTSDAPDPTLTDAEYRGLYEGFYVRAGADLGSVPWAALQPHPALTGWLDGHRTAGGTALVVGCGLGDDAEALAEHGCAVTAFDFSPTAIRRARERFPDSTVDYRVADLLDLPPDWRGRFDLVVEIRTLQSIPADRRAAAVTAIAETLAPGGTLLVHSFGTDEGGRFDGPPWPVTATQLAGFTGAGLVRTDYATEPVDGSESPLGPAPHAWSLTAIYRRPS